MGRNSSLTLLEPERRLGSRVRQLMELWSLELRRGPAPPANATAAPAQPAPILKAAGAGKAKGKRVSIVEPTPELPGQVCGRGARFGLIVPQCVCVCFR